VRGGWRPLLVLLTLSAGAQAENWPGWRGPRGDGTSLETNVPVRWSATNHVAWSAPLPGRGHGSPIVWDDRVFLLTALEASAERVVLCLDARTGARVWQRTVLTAPLEHKHSLNSYASSTPATDGRLVYATFLDRQEMAVAAFDFTGRQRWLVRPGPFASVHGFCSSPVLYGDQVIVNGDHDGDAFLVALDRDTGRTLWKIPRENRTRSYCTPLIRTLAGRTQLLLSGSKCVASYNPDTGARYWIIDGPTEQTVASLVYNERAGLLFYTGGFPELHILGIRPDGLGNVTATHIVWRTTQGVSYVPAPISFGDYFIVVSDAGKATCFQAADGKVVWSERLGAEHASLVSAGGLVYALADAGVTTVIKPGPAFQVVARNALDGKFFASPAISGGRLFLRSDQRLWCLGAGQSPGE